MRLNIYAALTTIILFCVPIPAQTVTISHKHIKGPFSDGPSVTRKCLECHDTAASEMMLTSHWTWSLKQNMGNAQEIDRGKKNVINNYCIALSSNWPRCTSCHVGYGWKDDTFDFSDKSNVDCLVCHDTTGTYKKDPTGAGVPVQAKSASASGPAQPGVDLLVIANSVGKPSRITCGTCHFYGGGGDGVKHGDLDSSLVDAELSLDVHMSPQGQNFTCQECHTTQQHQIKGNAAVVSPGGESHIACIDCHDIAPHSESRINQHIQRMACQTCHIPTFAREIPTKIYWDWSTAGQDRIAEPDKYGKPVFDKKKGSFKWEKNITPHYAWDNFTAGFYSLGEKIDPENVTILNQSLGNRQNPKARIYPFKIHKAKQIYDARFNILIVPKLFGPGGYWKTFDWNRAAELGMLSVGLNYSGEYAFTETVMYWRINHMVAPAEEALRCLDCHGDVGRLDWKALGYDQDPMIGR